MKKSSKPSSRKEKTSYQRRCTENNSSYYSNSLDNESPQYNNGIYNGDVNMEQENSQVDDDMIEDSLNSQSEHVKKSPSENGASQSHQNHSNGRKGDSKKRKQIKKNKSKSEKGKNVLKRTAEEQHTSYHRNTTESVEYFTQIRSLKIAKDREDIVESRSLGSKVSQFWGLTPTQIQDRIQQDLESISNAITTNERSESDGLSNSPNKDSERDNRSWRGNGSFRNGSGSNRGQNEVNYTRRLRTRRSRNPLVNH